MKTNRTGAGSGDMTREDLLVEGIAGASIAATNGASKRSAIR